LTLGAKRTYALAGEPLVLRTLLITLLALVPVSLAEVPSPGEDAAHAAAARFGRAMTSGDLSQLKPLLPSKGKVQLSLTRLGPEQGSFSASQVEALLRDFLAQGSVRNFEVTRVEYDPHGVAMASTRLELTGKDGRPGTVEIQLTFQPEGSQWVLREMRESPR
jgi:hypothetical protein